MSESPHSEPSVPSPDATEPSAKRGIRVSLLELILIMLLLAMLIVALTPWYRARQTRADVARVMADMRSVATAVEAYYIDWMNYPMCGLAEGPNRVMPNGAVFPSGTRTVHSDLPRGSGARRSFTFGLPTNFSTPHNLTTPIAYLQAFPQDRFADTWGATFSYFRPLRSWTTGAPTRFNASGLFVQFDQGWIMWSPGPDRDENAPNGPTDIGALVENIYDPSIPQPGATLIGYYYDATNGLYSEGDIIRVRN